MIKTRFAPSPTGSLHIGGIRTAIYAYALAKKNDGKFILRIEDTDQKREVEGARESLIKILEQFGISWDEYYVQSERVETGIYQKAAQKLVSQGNAFYCQCSAKNAKKEGFSSVLRDPCREKGYTSGAIKLKVPENKIVKYTDFVHNKKEITWNSNDVSDATLLKSDGFPTYHLAVVVDDTDMEITHVLRGHDWLPSTPIHLLVYEYLGFKVPHIGHLTDILDPEGGKLSKRKGSTTCEGLIEEGYLPKAIVNFVILLGWSPKDNKELYTLEEFVKDFDEKGFQKANPVFNRVKLDWFNGHYIREMNDDEYIKTATNFMAKNDDEEKTKEIALLVKDRVKKLSEIKGMTDFFFEKPNIDISLFGQNAKKELEVALSTLTNITSWTKDEMDEKLIKEVEKNAFKTGDFFMSLRLAITGVKFTPPINESMIILGREETLARIQNAINLLT